MNRPASSIAAVVVSCASLAARAPAAESILVTIDPAAVRQTIVGFGGTVGWIHPGERTREEVYDLLFTRLGVSFLRVRALGGEGGDELSIEPRNDNDDPNAFDWTAFPVRVSEGANARFIRAALDRGVKHVMPVTWSPPGWMKDSLRRAGGGTLERRNVEELAEAWAAYVVGMKREFGIEIRMLSIQNEPDLTYYAYPTCAYDPELYAHALATVQRRMDRERLGVSVLGPDVCRIYNLETYRDKMLLAGYAANAGGLWPRPLLTHLYDLAIPYHEVERDAPRWRAARELARSSGQPLWLMETANYLSYGARAGSFLEALIWARKIHHALADGDCEVVCYWSLFFDKVGEALVYCRKDGQDAYTTTYKYYTSMNYYRFVRPGMRRLAVECGDEDVFVTAFAFEPPRVDVVVALNWSHAPRVVRVAPQLDGSYRCFETTETRTTRGA
jgi:O-glycosyl hydrolase